MSVMRTAATGIQALIGKGLYTPSEAALYARLSVPTVNRWMFGNASGTAVLRPDGDPNAKILTYIDLMQLMAVREIRLNADIPISLQKIRDAVRRAEDDYGISFPLARRHTTFLCGNNIFVELGDERGLVQVSGKAAHNQVKRTIVEHFLKDVSFGSDGLMNAFDAFKYAAQKVVIQPDRRLGDPIVPSCGITAETLAHAYRIEGSLEAAAEAYGVTAEEVDVAYRYLDHIESRTAA